MKTIKYTGNERGWDELAVTGKQSVWYPGQVDQRADAEADLLVAAGGFVEFNQGGQVIYGTPAPDDGDNMPVGTIYLQTV